jgi:hypothetical protein
MQDCACVIESGLGPWPLRAALIGAVRGVGRAREGHLVDALALGGDEGRGTLRKALGSREQALIQGCPNGATPRASGILI